eukprot:982778-Pelagomonas_calceolata.AAC.8
MLAWEGGGASRITARCHPLRPCRYMTARTAPITRYAPTTRCAGTSKNRSFSWRDSIEAQLGNRESNVSIEADELSKGRTCSSRAPTALTFALTSTWDQQQEPHACCS